jgi:hypothetical protein
MWPALVSRIAQTGQEGSPRVKTTQSNRHGRVKVSAPVPVQPLPLLDLVLGVILIAGIGFAAGRSLSAAQGQSRGPLGWLLVAVPLPLVVFVRLAFPSAPLGGQGAFVAAVVAFAVGAVLVLCSRRDAQDDLIETNPDPAPWWPEFESEFRAYARRQPRSRVGI